MGTWNSLPPRTPESGDGLVGWDQSAGEEAQFRIGTALDQLPSNQLLNEGINIGPPTAPIFHAAQIVDNPNLIPAGTICYLLIQPVSLNSTSINGSVQYGDSNRQVNLLRFVGHFRSATEAAICADYMGADDSGARLLVRAPIETARVSLGGVEYWALKFTQQQVLPINPQARFNGFKASTQRLQFQPASAVTELAVQPFSYSRHAGRPGDSIGNRGALAAVSQALGQRTDWNGGIDTQSGNGVTTVFSIAHGLGGTPTSVSVTPASSAAAGQFRVSSVTSTNIVLTYTTAPMVGTDNLSWHWNAMRKIA
jgi:hypothetical protein